MFSFPRRLLSTVLAAGAVALVAAAPAAADHPDDGVGLEQVGQALGPSTELAGSGLYRVTLESGERMLSHGPDLQLRDLTPGASGFGNGSPERDPFCGGDYYQHVLYARASTSPDDYAASKPVIQTAIRRMNAVLNSDSLASGGPTADYRVLCEAGGEVRVDSFTVAVGSSYSAIVNAAQNAGFDESNVDYTIFFDGNGGGACGIGSYYDDDRLVVNNYNNRGGSYGITYKGCWNNGTPMHENGHNQGAVQYDAPYSTGSGGHCIDERDVMCYSPDGGDKNQGGTISRCTDRVVFDCGFDSYFDSAPEPGEWLETHWNMGSPLNRFIVFGTEPNVAPEASFGFSCSDLSCGFTDTSTDSDGSIESRSWNFGDGSSASAANPDHTYAEAGTYTVALEVTDDRGSTAQAQQQVTVTAPSGSGGGGSGGGGSDEDSGGGGDSGGGFPDPFGLLEQLFNRLPVGGELADQGSWAYHPVKVPKRAKVLKVKLTGPPCFTQSCDPDLDLYLARKALPDESVHACAPLRIGSRELCKIKRPRKGKWFAGINAHEASSASPYVVKAVIKKQKKKKKNRKRRR